MTRKFRSAPETGNTAPGIAARSPWGNWAEPEVGSPQVRWLTPKASTRTFCDVPIFQTLNYNLTMRFTKAVSDLTHPGFWLVSTALLTTLATPGLAQSPAIRSGDTIAFLGDSITEGGWGSPVGYVRLVMSAFESNGIEAKAIPAGISGHKSNDMLERLRRDVLDKKPTWMTLSCGVNDVWHGANGVPLSQYKTNITAIIEQAQAAGIKALVLTSTVIGEDLPNQNNQKLAPYNDFLRTLAKEKNCLLADANADLQAALATADPAARKQGNLFTTDGVHMNPQGNLLMASSVLRAFGLASDQMLKAREVWMNIPNGVNLSGKRAISLKQYEQLKSVADQRKLSVSQLIDAEFSGIVSNLLKGAGQ